MIAIIAEIFKQTFKEYDRDWNTDIIRKPVIRFLAYGSCSKFIITTSESEGRKKFKLDIKSTGGRENELLVADIEKGIQRNNMSLGLLKSIHDNFKGDVKEFYYCDRTDDPTDGECKVEKLTDERFYRKLCDNIKNEFIPATLNVSVESLGDIIVGLLIFIFFLSI